MKALSNIYLLAFIMATPLFGQTKKEDSHSHQNLHISFNKNVEFLGFVYFLGFEGPELESDPKTIEINGKVIEYKEWYGYGYSLYKQYKPFIASKHLEQIADLADHLWLDYLSNLLLQLDDFPHAKIREDISPKFYRKFSEFDNIEEARQNTDLFIESLNRFYEEVNFDQYFIKSQKFYDQALKEINDNLPAEDIISAIESFYQHSFKSYNLVPSLTIPPGMGLGLSIDEQQKIFNVFGAFDQQNLRNKARLKMGFANKQRLRELTVHEFGHSFVNPAIDSLPQKLIDETQFLYEPIKSAMVPQGYPNWKYCLDEHFVRGGEVLISRLMGFEKEAADLLHHYHLNRSFIYLPIIVDELEKYASDQSIGYSTAVEAALHRMKKELGESSSAIPKGDYVLKGMVKDAKTGEVLPYVNIGILKKNIGVISIENGTYEIALKHAHKDDTLAFSLIGYDTYFLKLDHIQKNPMEILLNPRDIILKEVIVSADRSGKPVKLGRTNLLKITTGEAGIGNVGWGTEWGIKIYNDGKTYRIKDINFHHRSNTLDSILYRINIYSVKDGLPHESLIQKQIFVKSYKRQKWVTKNIESENLIIDQDIIVTFELVQKWFDPQKHNYLFYSHATGYDRGGAFVRPSSMGEWVEQDEPALALFLTVEGY